MLWRENLGRIFNPRFWGSEAGSVILAVAVGLITGAAAIGFRALIEFFNSIFLVRGWGWAQAHLPYGRAALPAIVAAGFFAVGLLILFFAREAKGHGVPEVMAAVAARGGVIRPRVALVKALASSICIGAGGAAGREGPIVQIGSSLGSATGQLLRLPALRIKTLVGCGAAAGIAATFNAPIAGALFSLEVILGDFGFANFAPVVVASVAGAAVGRWYFGNTPSLTVLHFQQRSWLEFIFYGFLGVVFGLAGPLFSRVLYGAEDFFDKTMRRIPYLVRVTAGGAIVGAVGIFLPEVLGTGYRPIDLAVANLYPLYFLLILFAGNSSLRPRHWGRAAREGCSPPRCSWGPRWEGHWGLSLRAFSRL